MVRRRIAPSRTMWTDCCLKLNGRQCVLSLIIRESGAHRTMRMRDRVATTESAPSSRGAPPRAPTSVMAGRVPRLSGSIFVDKAHGVDSSVLQAFGDVLGHGEGSSHAASQ